MPKRDNNRRVEPRPEGKPVKVALQIPVHPDLKKAVGAAAEEADLPMNEWIAQVLANHLGHPELAAIPRKRYGRPRKEPASAV